MNFEQEFKREFGNKYEHLHLKNAVIRKNDGTLTVTFLYPSADKELTDQEKAEITNWLKSQLGLEKMGLRVKFLRVYLEERLIQKAIKDFFDRKHKLINTYLKDDSFVVKCTPFDVQVQVELSPRLQELFNEHKVPDELAKYLKENFLVDFAIIPHVNNDLVDEVDIDNVEMKTTYRATPKHRVEIIKLVAGTKFSGTTKVEQKIEGLEETETHEYIFAEYINNIKSAKENVTIAGYLRKIERKDFVIKQGKRVGQEKAYFPFLLQDFRGKMDGVYFCPKVYLAEMEKLEEAMFVVVHGKVKPNQLGKMQIIADKIALAEPVKEPKKEQRPVEIPENSVVEIEKLSAVEQDSMFGKKNKYNKKITGRTIVVFDCETTGLDREADEIIEIGAVKIDDGNIIEKFSTFVRPIRPIPYAVTKLTGITQEMVENAPPIEAVIRDFHKFAEGCVLCGHNVIDFDIHFVRRAGKLVGLDFDHELIDTINEARVARLRISKFNLANVTRVLGISLEGAHRAWNDAFATAQVLLKLNLA